MYNRYIFNQKLGRLISIRDVLWISARCRKIQRYSIRSAGMWMQLMQSKYTYVTENVSSKSFETITRLIFHVHPVSK